MFRLHARRTVPIEAEPLEVALRGVAEAAAGAWAVEVLEAQEDAACLRAGAPPRAEKRARVTKV